MHAWNKCSLFKEVSEADDRFKNCHIKNYTKTTIKGLSKTKHKKKWCTMTDGRIEPEVGPLVPRSSDKMTT